MFAYHDEADDVEKTGKASDRQNDEFGSRGYRSRTLKQSKYDKVADTENSLNTEALGADDSLDDAK